MGSITATTRGNHRPKSGHATAHVERFVHVILRKSSPFALLICQKHSSLVYIPFGVRFLCIVYSVYGHSGVDSKDKLYTFCTLC